MTLPHFLGMLNIRKQGIGYDFLLHISLLLFRVSVALGTLVKSKKSDYIFSSSTNHRVSKVATPLHLSINVRSYSTSQFPALRSRPRALDLGRRIKIYNNPDLQKLEILKENRGQSGVYR